MSFKSYFNLSEGLIKVPSNEINNYVDSHFNELVSKIKETAKTGYENSIDDNLIVNGKEIPLVIVKKIPNSNAYMSVNLAKGDDIYLDATNILELKTTQEKLKSFLKQSLIHEITHLLDKGAYKKPAISSNDDYSNYVNSEREFPALANEMIHKISQMSPKQKLDLINSFRFKTKIKDKDLSDFISYLTPKNKIKFIGLVTKNILK